MIRSRSMWKGWGHLLAAEQEAQLRPLVERQAGKLQKIFARRGSGGAAAGGDLWEALRDNRLEFEQGSSKILTEVISPGIAIRVRLGLNNLQW